MKLKPLLKKLEKKQIISRKPHPLIPFILAFISLALYLIISQTPTQPLTCIRNLPQSLDSLLTLLLLILTIFTFIFAILHLIVVKILEK